MNIKNNEKGIAIILALIMLLVMSVMALTVSFISNINFKAMSSHKRGHEAFMAAESCVREGRKRLETIGVESLFFELQAVFDPTLVSTSADIVIIKPTSAQDNPADDPSLWKGPMCRSGPRKWDKNDGPAKFVAIPPPTKALGRPPRRTSLPSGGAGGAALIPVSFTVVGKDSQDLDKDDSDLTINTGTEIAVGLESFIPGGATNVY